LKPAYFLFESQAQSLLDSNCQMKGRTMERIVLTSHKRERALNTSAAWLDRGYFMQGICSLPTPSQARLSGSCKRTEI